MKLFEKRKIDTYNHKIREISFLGLPIIHYGEKQYETKKHTYLNILPTKSFLDFYFENILKDINLDYDDIYFLRTGSGECYLLMFFVQLWCKKNGSKKPLFICNKYYHTEMFNLWNTNINTIFKPINVPRFDTLFSKIRMKYKGHNVYTFLPQSFFVELNNIISKNKTYNLDFILNKLKIEKDKLQPLPKLKTSQTKLQELGIDPDKFVLIAPEAVSCNSLNKEFFFDLFKAIKSKGYDIILNTNEDWEDNSFTTKFYGTFTDLYNIGSYAKAIITMRSGLSEFLSTCNCNQFVIITDLPNYNLSSETIETSYNMNLLPFINKENIHQYNISHWDLMAIKEDILRNL